MIEPVPSPAPISRRLILTFCCLGMIVMSFAVNAPALCLTAIAGEFRFDNAASGVFLSFGFWGLFLGIMISGVIADRWGARVLLVAGGIFQVAGFLVVGFASTTGALFAGTVLCGMGSGIADALLSPLVCAIYPESRARASNVLHTFYPTGTLLLVPVVLILFEGQWSWRWIYRLLAVGAVPYALSFAMIALPQRLHFGADRLSARRLLRSGSFFLLLSGIFLAGVTELGPSQWLPAYIEKATGGTRGAGTLGLLVFGATMAGGRFFTSYLVQTINLKWFFLGGGLICAVSLLLASLPAPVWFTIVCLSMMGLGVAGFWPTIIACAGNIFPRGGVSMFSLLAAVGNLGGVAGPLIIGLVAERSGLRVGMGVLVLAPILAVAMLRLLPARPVES